MNTVLKSILFAGALAFGISTQASGTKTDSPRTQFLTTEGGAIAYDDTEGSGQLVIALPGMGDLRHQYRYLRPFLSHAGYRVVTMDVRGQGESSVEWSDYSAHAAARDVLALMNKLGATSAIVIGNSFAAGAAAWAAHLAPEKIKGIVLIGPIMRDLPTSPWVNALVKIGFMGPWRNWFWMTYWDSLFPAQRPADYDQYRARLKNSLREPGRMQTLRTMVSLSKADTEAILGKIRTPSLIVMGTRDADFQAPAKEAELLASRLHADVVLAEGAGHYPHTEMPEEVGPKIVAFIQQLKRSDSLGTMAAVRSRPESRPKVHER